MEMIIGGAYQGKADYAKAQFPDVDWKFGGEITEEELLKAAGVLEFQEYIRKALKAGEDLTGLAEKLAQQDPDVPASDCLLPSDVRRTRS